MNRQEADVKFTVPKLDIKEYHAYLRIGTYIYISQEDKEKNDETN